jgi:hypothetical protein
MNNELLFICRLLSFLIMYFWSEVKSVMIDSEVCDWKERVVMTCLFSSQPVIRVSDGAGATISYV